jgi:hypothetical protein
MKRSLRLKLIMNLLPKIRLDHLKIFQLQKVWLTLNFLSKMTRMSNLSPLKNFKHKLKSEVSKDMLS